MDLMRSSEPIVSTGLEYQWPVAYDTSMKHPVVFRVAKLSTMGNIAASAEHTWRQRPGRTADPARSHLNEDWREVKSSQQLQEAVQARLATLTELPKAKRTPCLEYIVTAHHDAFKEAGGPVDWRSYFKDAVAWLEKLHGAENIVAVNVQLDELTPHLVVYAVPLIEEKAKKVRRSIIVGKNPDGSLKREVREVEKQACVRLGASTFIDGRKKLSQMQTDFAQQVGAKHGLVRGVKGSQATHVTTKEWQNALGAPAKHAQIKPEFLVPKVFKKGYFTNDAESDEERAQRVMEAMHRFYDKPVQLAKTAEIQRKRARELQQTLDSIQDYYGEYFERLERLKKLDVEKREVLALLDERIAQAEASKQRVHEQLEQAARNMELALQMSHGEALKRATYLLESGEYEEFGQWLKYEPAVQTQELPEVVRAKQAKEFIKTIKPKPEEPGFEP